MSNPCKPPFKVEKRIDYYVVTSDSGDLIDTKDEAEANLVCAMANHYSEHSPEKVEEKNILFEIVKSERNVARAKVDELTAQNSAMAEALEEISKIDITGRFDIYDAFNKAVEIATAALQANKITNDKTE